MTPPKSSRNLLYLIDGDALLYRAANAVPFFTSPAGVPINGLRGFAAMLRTLLRAGHPARAAVAFTADPPLRKHALDPRYKINHYEHPDEIKAQIPLAIRVVRALGAHAFLEPGLEADDVIATLLARHSRAQTRIITSDRDFYQLTSERVRLLLPVRGVSEMREVGPEEVMAALGVRPSLVPDFKALTGDPSDDIPGVPGVGPKTAAALLRQFPSVETLLEGLENVTMPGIRPRLHGMRDRILLNKRLASILPVPMEGAHADLRRGPPDRAELRRLADETGLAFLAELE